MGATGHLVAVCMARGEYLNADGVGVYSTLESWLHPSKAAGVLVWLITHDWRGQVVELVDTVDGDVTGMKDITAAAAAARDEHLEAFWHPQPPAPASAEEEESDS